MKILSKVMSLIMAMLIIFALTSTTQINTFASLSIDSNNRSVANVGVLLYSFDDPYLLLFRQSLEDIEKENKDKVRFTFYDGKNNIGIQNETLDSLVKSNIDLFIINLVNTKENIVEDVILKVKQKDVPLILIGIDPQVIAKVSKNYDKVAFTTLNMKQEGIAQGKILANLWNTNKTVIDKNGDNILQYVLLKGRVDSPIAIERTKNVISTLNDSGIKTEELALINTKWSKELAEASIYNLFLKYGSRIEAIIANNDAMAIGAIEALQKYGYNNGDKTKNIAVVGIDGLPEAKDLVDKGLMTGTVIQDPRAYAEGLYIIGMNLINNINPIENTNYKFSNGEIIIEAPLLEYTKKTNTP